MDFDPNDTIAAEDDEEMTKILRKKVVLDEDNFYSTMFYVKWSSGRHTWESENDIFDSPLLAQFQKEQHKRSQVHSKHIAREHDAYKNRKVLPPVEGSRFPNTKENKLKNYNDKLTNKPKPITANRYVYVPPISNWAPPPYQPTLLVDSLLNSLTMLWSEYEYESKVIKEEEYVPTDIDFYESGLSVVNTERKSRVLTLTSIVCHYVARNLNKYPLAIWLPLPLKARIFIYLVKYRFSLIEKNLVEHLTFLLDPYLSTLDLSMFNYRISNSIVDYVASRCRHLTTLKLGDCANVTDIAFENLCKVCTNLRIVDVTNCIQIYSFNELITSGNFNLISFSATIFSTVDIFLSIIKVFSYLRVLHLTNIQFITGSQNLENLDVTANCTNLVSLKLDSKLQAANNDIFISFLSLNKFPNLEILETNLNFKGEKSTTFFSHMLQQPCYGLTSFSFRGGHATLTSRDLEKFSNLKEIKYINTENVANLYFQDLLHQHIEVLDLSGVTLRSPNELVKFLLRPAARHLKKISLASCYHSNYIDQQDRVESEISALFSSWKPAPLPQLTYLSVTRSNLKLFSALSSLLFAQSCTNLTYLDLSGQSTPSHHLNLLFERNTKLETVILVACPVQDSCIEILLTHCQGLSVLDLSGTEVTKALLDIIAVQRPKLWKLHLGCLPDLQLRLLQFFKLCQDFLDHIYICPCFWRIDTTGIDVTLHHENDCSADEYLSFSLFD